MKLTHRPSHEQARHADRDAVVQRVIDLAGPTPTEKLVINLTTTPFYVDRPAWPDGPTSKILLTLPDGRVDLLPLTSARRRNKHGRHDKRGLLAVARRAIRSRVRHFDALTVLAITGAAAVGLVMGTVVAFQH